MACNSSEPRVTLLLGDVRLPAPYLQGYTVLAVGDVQLRRHVDEVIADKAGVALQSLLHDTQRRRQVVALVVTPGGNRYCQRYLSLHWNNDKPTSLCNALASNQQVATRTMEGKDG